MAGEALKKIEWCAEKHITREYRTATLGEHEAREILADYAALVRERDEAVAEVERLRGCLTQANANHEEFERKWYLACDDRDRLREALESIANFKGNPRTPTTNSVKKSAIARAALAGRE